MTLDTVPSWSAAADSLPKEARVGIHGLDNLLACPPQRNLIASWSSRATTEVVKIVEGGSWSKRQTAWCSLRLPRC